MKIGEGEYSLRQIPFERIKQAAVPYVNTVKIAERHRRIFGQ